MTMSNSTFGTGVGGNNPAPAYNDADQPSVPTAPFPTQTPAKPGPNSPNAGYESYSKVK